MRLATASRRRMLAAICLLTSILLMSSSAVAVMTIRRGATPIGCGRLYPVLVGSAVVGCTHGPDPAPPGINPQRPRPIPGQESQPREATAMSAPQVPCYGDGQSGDRVQAIYAYPADKPDRYASVAPSISTWAAEMDQVFDESAKQTGGVRHVRFVTDSNCNLVIDKVQLTSTGDDTFGNTMTEMRAMGFDSPDRKYLLWMDSTVLCGIAGYYVDDTPGDTNANDGTASGQVARVDSGCWGLASQGQSIEAHELMHTLGAVMPDAPHATPMGHCTDGADRMCYDDGSGLTQQSICPTSNEAYFDCNHDDYFSTEPAEGSYLASHWNAADSAFLAPADPPVAEPPPSPAPSSSPSPASSPPESLLPSGVPPTIGPPSSRLQPLRPSRLVSFKQGRIRAHSSLDVPVAGRAGVPASGANAVVLDITAVSATTRSSLTAYPDGQSSPTGATMVIDPSQPRTALAVVPLGSDGAVRVANRFGTAHVTVDVIGWFDADGTSAEGRTSGLPGSTVLDTRAGIGSPPSRLRAGASRRLSLAGRAGVPTGGVSAVWLEVKASRASRTGSITMYAGGRSRPTATTLAFGPRHSTSALALVPVGPDVSVELTASGAATDLSVQAVGWVDDGSNAAPAGYHDVSQALLVDTASSGNHRPLTPRHYFDVQVTGNGGVPSSGVTAAVVTVVAAASTADGYLSCYRANASRPLPAAVDYWRHAGAAQTISVSLSPTGSMRVFDGGATTRVLVYVEGYFASS